MRGNNPIKVPGELYAPTVEGVLVSADGVRDYIQRKSQETLNQDLINESAQTRQIAAQAAASAASMENIITILQNLGEQDVARALQHEVRIQHNETGIAQLQSQLGDYIITEVTEAEMEALIEDDEADDNTLYLIPEEEEED